MNFKRGEGVTMKIKVLGENGKAEAVPIITKERLACRKACEAFKIGFEMGAAQAKAVYYGGNING